MMLQRQVRSIELCRETAVRAVLKDQGSERSRDGLCLDGMIRRVKLRRGITPAAYKFSIILHILEFGISA